MHIRIWLIALAVPLAACGGPTSADDGADRAAEEARASQDAAAREAEEAAAAEARRGAQEDRYDACADAVADLSDAIGEINSRLAVGLSNDEYGSYVGDARVEYDALLDELETGEVTNPCIRKVAVPLENALQDHIDVYNDWSDCIQNYPCDFNEGQTNEDAQTAWVRASDRTDSSGEALENMRP